MNDILYIMREIDTHLGGDCRVNVTVGGAVGTAESEDPIEAEESLLSVFVGDTVYVFEIPDTEWFTRDDLVKLAVDYIEGH